MTTGDSNRFRFTPSILPFRRRRSDDTRRPVVPNDCQSVNGSQLGETGVGRGELDEDCRIGREEERESSECREGTGEEEERERYRVGLLLHALLSECIVQLLMKARSEVLEDRLQDSAFSRNRSEVRQLDSHQTRSSETSESVRGLEA